jgi:hypothetical protein
MTGPGPTLIITSTVNSRRFHVHRPALAALAASIALAVFTLTGSAAAAANQVGPGQGFVGRVNGSFGDATVTVICPGPGGPKGHPAAGQQLEVLSPPPPVAAGVEISVGQTGTAAHAIVAKFSDDGSVPTRFGQYFVNQPIPTSLLLPCSGFGRVVFRPTPNSPTARPSGVSVHYVNPAASGVAGTVLFSPTCPVVQVPPTPACAPKPGAAHIQLLRSDGAVAAQGDAGSNGQFFVSVQPGRYTVVATTPPPMIGRGCTAAPTQVTVTGDGVAHVSVSCDTGIR